MPTLVAYAMVAAAGVIVVEGALSFLGLSVQLPQSTWGNMINQARRDIKVSFGQVLYPALILTFTVLALNQVGALPSVGTATPKRPGRRAKATHSFEPGRSAMSWPRSGSSTERTSPPSSENSAAE